MVRPKVQYPKFSIVTPTYNRGHSVVRCLESALSQSGSIEVEVVIVDDSVDDTPEIIQRYISDHGLENVVRFYRNEVRAGIPRSRNRGIDMASGDYVVFLDSDDELLPGALERSSRCFDEHPNITVCFGAVRPKSGRKHLVDPNLAGREIGYHDFLASSYVGEYLPVCHVSALQSNRFVEEIQGFESLLWASILRAGNRAFLTLEPMRLYDDIGGDRLSKATVDGDLRVAANHAVGYTRFLSEFGEDLEKAGNGRYRNCLMKAIVYHKLAGGRNPAVAEFIAANISRAGAAGHIINSLPRSAALAIFHSYHVVERLRARIRDSYS